MADGSTKDRVESMFIIRPYTPVELTVKNSKTDTVTDTIVPETGPYSNEHTAMKASLASKVRNATCILKTKTHT